ncbi:gluconokinase [Fodinibius salsisoli]|nr:gluconokinase [Fodinibius salsisoli]
MVYIMMGVSGAGKTLVGQKLAKRMDLPFFDGDNFHPEANIQKMASGQPLNDNDRRPWLEYLAKNVKEWQQSGGAVLACSALKQKYRATLTSQEEASFIYLKGTLSLIASRLAERSDHFMPEELLQSQFEALEEPREAITVSIDQPPGEIVDDIIAQIQMKEQH